MFTAVQLLNEKCSALKFVDIFNRTIYEQGCLTKGPSVNITNTSKRSLPKQGPNFPNTHT